MTINNILLDSQYFQISWYSFLYFVSFLFIFILANIRRKSVGGGMGKQSFVDIFFLLIFFSVLGGRIGHVLFYEWGHYSNHLIEIFFIWQGGMSFFSALFFSGLALFMYSKKYKKPFFVLSDFALSFVPLGIFLGRIGNFLNNEIWGVDKYGILPKIAVGYRDKIIYKLPIQLYEAFFEGLLLFILLQYLAYKKVKSGTITIVFLFLYSIFRFILEFFKHPYSNVYILKYLTFSQTLSIVMFFIATIFWMYNKGRKGR